MPQSFVAGCVGVEDAWVAVEDVLGDDEGVAQFIDAEAGGDGVDLDDAENGRECGKRDEDEPVCFCHCLPQKCTVFWNHRGVEITESF